MADEPIPVQDTPPVPPPDTDVMAKLNSISEEIGTKFDELNRRVTTLESGTRSEPVRDDSGVPDTTQETTATTPAPDSKPRSTHFWQRKIW